MPKLAKALAAKLDSLSEIHILERETDTQKLSSGHCTLMPQNTKTPVSTPNTQTAPYIQINKLMN